MGITWATVTLEVSATEVAALSQHWSEVTGHAPVSSDATVVTLTPSDGDPVLRLRASGDAGTLLLALGSDDAESLVASVLSHGGSAVATEGGRTRCTSPGGLVFDVTGATGAEVRPGPVTWADGRRSTVDQVSIDVPADSVAAETTFWQALTGWELRPGALPEFQSLVRPAGLPFRLLLQSRLEGDGPVRAHLDLACDDVAAEQARHEAFGARTTYVGSFWSTLVDPTGRAYCLTPRNPVTGIVG